MTPDEIIEYVSDNNPDAVMFTGPDFRSAIVGWVENEDGLPVICYDYWKMVASLVWEYEAESHNKDDYDFATDAIEWIDYNTIRTLPYIDRIGRPVILYN